MRGGVNLQIRYIFAVINLGIIGMVADQYGAKPLAIAPKQAEASKLAVFVGAQFIARKVSRFNIDPTKQMLCGCAFSTNWQR